MSEPRRLNTDGVQHTDASRTVRRISGTQYTGRSRTVKTVYDPRTAARSTAGQTAAQTSAADPYAGRYTAGGQTAAQQQTARTAPVGEQADQAQIEAARARARAAANQGTRRRVVQQPVRSGRSPMPRHAQQTAGQAAQQTEAAQTAPAQDAELPMTRARQQALAYRRAAEEKYGDTISVPAEDIRSRQAEQAKRRAAAAAAEAARTAPQVREVDLRAEKAAKPAYNYDDDPAYRGGIDFDETGEADGPEMRAAAARHEQEHGRKKGRRADKPAKPAKGAKGEKGGKKKKKHGCLFPMLIALAIIAAIVAGTYFWIMSAIAPSGGSIKLSQLINTPKEYQGKELNLLVTGVDRSSTDDLSAGASNDSDVNDGMTDMILYVHFNNETGELKMLQIPRDTMVTTDTSVSSNYRINAVAKTQGSDSSNNMAALCELVAEQYQIPIDGYVTIRLEMLTELVDLFGGVEIYVPFDIDYTTVEGGGSSVIHQGYQTLDGAAIEFMLRARKIYSDGDITRLNVQRQFYAALFRKIKSIGNIWDVAKLTPAVLNYMETDLSASELVSFAVSMLNIDSSKIMICQMPVINGPTYNNQALLYPARQEDADLLNQYFRENTGAVDAGALQLCDNAVDLSGYTATDPNVQYLGSLMTEADEAQKTENLDGSSQVADVMASEASAESDDADSEPAA